MLSERAKDAYYAQVEKEALAELHRYREATSQTAHLFQRRFGAEDAEFEADDHDVRFGPWTVSRTRHVLGGQFVWTVWRECPRCGESVEENARDLADIGLFITTVWREHEADEAKHPVVLGG